jgi:hypothetical protein
LYGFVPQPKSNNEPSNLVALSLIAENRPSNQKIIVDKKNQFRIKFFFFNFFNYFSEHEFVIINCSFYKLLPIV